MEGVVDEAQGARVVRHHDDRLAEVVLELAQQREDRLGVARVEIAGRLVGDDQIGIGDDGARDGDALLLAARERARVVVEPLVEADDAQRGLGALQALGLVEMREQQRQRDVVARVEHRDQVEELEDQADVPRAPVRQLVLGEIVEPLAGDDAPRRRSAGRCPRPG